ncbi:FUSC family protein [Rhodococcus sp. IEGM 248]|uniref:FUSC family protein n=1 Tax=Rhodococcus opacus TaxID=37919 RepID=UPI0013C165A9|nr:FUSC family protein [Rhodococcus opacus]MDV7083749.1 FUSC family protein [Rhodococcus opacus]NDV04346.1 FUSC family protein [Rhodococcus sp. IEGM 248]
MQASPRYAPDLSRLHRSRGALAYSMAPSTWRRAFEVRDADATIAPALRVGAATALVLVIGGFLGHGNLSGFAALGALTAAFGRYEPYPRLARKTGLVGVALIAFVAGGALLGAAGLSLWLQIAVMSVVSGVAAWLLAAFRIAGPGPVILIFAATAAVGHATQLSDLGPAVVAVAIGVVVGWLAAMTPCLFVPLGPARLAVARALAAAAELEHAHDASAIASARKAIDNARDVIAHSGRGRDGHSHQLFALLAEADTVVDRWAHERDHDTLRALVDHESELRKVKRRSDLSSFGSEIAVLPKPGGFFADGVQALQSREGIVNAARIAAAAALAGWICVAMGLEHPLWASMGAMAAMQGFNFSQTVQRGIQRLVGNVAGAVLAAGLIAAAMGYWQTVVVIVVLQTVTELVVIKNYAFASVAITPMALLLTGLGSAVAPDIAVSRVVDTLIGVVVGVVVSAVAISRTDHHHVD